MLTGTSCFHFLIPISLILVELCFFSTTFVISIINEVEYPNTRSLTPSTQICSWDLHPFIIRQIRKVGCRELKCVCRKLFKKSSFSLNVGGKSDVVSWFLPPGNSEDGLASKWELLCHPVLASISGNYTGVSVSPWRVCYERQCKNWEV